MKKVGGLSNLVSWRSPAKTRAPDLLPAGRVLLPQHLLHEHGMHLCKHIWEGIEDYSHYPARTLPLAAAVQAGGLRCDSQTSYYEAVPENAFLGEITVDKVTVQTYADQASLMMALASWRVRRVLQLRQPD